MAVNTSDWPVCRRHGLLVADSCCEDCMDDCEPLEGLAKYFFDDSGYPIETNDQILGEWVRVSELKEWLGRR